MFVIQSGNAKAARKTSFLMAIVFTITHVAVFGLLLTMHFYVKPSPTVRKGLRILGVQFD